MTDPAGSTPLAEFDRQVQVLVDRAYPEALDLDVAAFRAELAILRDLAGTREATTVETSRVPFVLVVGADVVPAGKGIGRCDLDGKAGFTSMTDDDLARFVRTGDVAVPPGLGYLLVDVDPGADLVDMPPAAALPTIRERGRSPLTVAEGIALTLQRPDLLAGGSRYSLLGSRCGDARVPAIWVSERRPRLGWCWDGAPHSWLGSASCAARLPS